VSEIALCDRRAPSTVDAAPVAGASGIAGEQFRHALTRVRVRPGASRRPRDTVTGSEAHRHFRSVFDQSGEIAQPGGLLPSLGDKRTDDLIDPQVACRSLDCGSQRKRLAEHVAAVGCHENDGAWGLLLFWEAARVHVPIRRVLMFGTSPSLSTADSR